jgi:hypothetical protein
MCSLSEVESEAMSAAALAAVLVWQYLECANAAANDRPTGTADRSSKYEKTTMMDPLSDALGF